jgi:hypothetical protein
MNRNTIYILVAVLVVVIVVAGVGLYLYMGTGGGGGGGGGETKNTYTVTNATSLQIAADVTEQGTTVTQKWAVKNVNSTQQMLRLDLLGGESGNYSYIFVASNQTAWTAVNGVWSDISGDYSAQWSFWDTRWTNLVTALANWSGTGNYSYTGTGGASVKVYDVSINPTLADSLFKPS